MNRRQSIHRLAWALGSLIGVLGNGAVRADDLWITTEVAEGSVVAVINYGHPSEREATDLHKVVELAVVGPPKQVLTEHLKRARRSGVDVLVSNSIPVPKTPQLIATRYDNGIWSKVGDTWVNASREMLPQATECDWSTKYAKALLPASQTRSDAYRIRVGHPLELVPQVDPLSLKMGDVVPVLVLLDGKPLAHVKVEGTDGKTPLQEEQIPRYETDTDGIARVPVSHGGLQLFAVDYSVAAADPVHTPAKLYNATFAFVLP